MSYTADHTDDECDKCLEKVGKKNLERTPFLYMDKGDKMHPDMSKRYGFSEPGYRQYHVCKNCKTK